MSNCHKQNIKEKNPHTPPPPPPFVNLTFLVAICSNFFLKNDVEEFDPQTEADRSAQRLIIGSLSKLYPDLVIIGEEVGIYNSLILMLLIKYHYLL